MAWYPDADTSVKGNSSGSYKGGPWHLILHTTEGGSAEGAFSAYRNNNTWPHFTIDSSTIYQHIDTSTAASAVLNESGGVETNRLSSIQIEMVAFAGEAKSHAMLENVAAVCRWLENHHGIPAQWPNGRPQGSNGPHNRSSSNWTSEAGYYGHSQVPENSHWDPGALSDDELAILMGGIDVGLSVNGSDQTGAIGCRMSSGNSWMDVSDWCKYADYPNPTFDQDSDMVQISTKRVHCQVRVGGVRCANLSVEEYPIPIAGQDQTLPTWICQEHKDEFDNAKPQRAT